MAIGIVHCATGTGRGCVAVLPLPDVPFRQTEHSGAMDWPYPRGDRGHFSYLVDATAFRSLTSAGFRILPSSQNMASRGHPPSELQQASIFCKDAINDESHDGL